MKRLFASLAILASALFSWAQSSPYVGTAVSDIADGDYYLYNVDTKTWLGDNYTNTNRWTSRAELSSRGIDIEVTKQGNGYRLNPKLGGNHSLNADNLYMDTNNAVTTWTITAVDGTENGVKLTSGNYTLGADGSGLIINNASSRNVWQLVTREERMAVDTQNATADGVDISWAVYGGTFPIADERRANWWQGSYGSNNIGGDDYYHCNRVWEMWAINERNVYQTLTDLPDGVYGVSAQAIYVSSGNSSTSSAHYNAYLDGTEPTNGYVFAGDTRVPMINMYSMVTDQSVPNFNTRSLGNGKYVPDATVQYSNHIFRGDGLTDEVKVVVHDGKLTFGVQVEDGKGGAWIIFDNFNLKYYGMDALTDYYPFEVLQQLIAACKAELPTFPDATYAAAISEAESAIDYTVPSYIHSHILARYNSLLEARHEWAMRRIGTAMYETAPRRALAGVTRSNLPAGRYRVAMQACSMDGNHDHALSVKDNPNRWFTMTVNGQMLPLKSVTDEMGNCPSMDPTTPDFADTETMAEKYFYYGLYDNSITVDVEEGGSIQVTFSTDKPDYDSWYYNDKLRIYYEGVPFEPTALASYDEYLDASPEVILHFSSSTDAAFVYGAEQNIKVLNAEGNIAATVTNVTNYVRGVWKKQSTYLSLSNQLPAGTYTVVIPAGSMVFKETGFTAFNEDVTLTLEAGPREQGEKGQNPNPYLTGNEPVQTYADGVRIAWQYNKQRYIGPGSYGRVKRLSDDSYVMVYSTGGSNIGGQNFIRFQSEAYGEWTEAQIQKDNDITFTNKNAEFIELPDGRLMYAWLHRINYDINDVGVSKIMCAFSSDKGKTWEDEQCIYEGTATYGLGVWEPCMLLLPTGELQVYWANEAAAGAPSQNISMRRSWNMGRTWVPGTVTVCYRPGSRDGMPVPCYLQNEKGIIVAIEDPGFMGTFKPMLVHTSVEDNWSGPYVDANSPDRWSIFQTDPKLSSEVYSGQPYVIQLTTGETVYSAVCADGRNPNTNDTHAPMAVWVGNGDGKDFIARSYPFPFATEPNARCIWPSIMQYNDSTLMAVGTVEGECKHSGIWTSEGIIMRPISSVQTYGTPDWPSLEKCIFLGAESQAEARVRSMWDADHLYYHVDVKDDDLNPATGTDLTAGDAIEICLATAKPTSNSRRTSQYRVLVGADGSSSFYYGSSSSWKTSEEQIACTVTAVDGGYTVDVAIPWAAVGGKPSADELYMFYRLHNRDIVDGKTVTIHENLSGSTIDKAMNWMRMPLMQTSGIEELLVPSRPAYGNHTYNLQGQIVSDSYRGIVIKEGRKVVIR